MRRGDPDASVHKSSGAITRDADLGICVRNERFGLLAATGYVCSRGVAERQCVEQRRVYVLVRGLGGHGASGADMGYASLRG